PALLPWLQYLAWSSTGASSASLARWSERLSPWLILHLLMPLASGGPSRAAVLSGAFGLPLSNNFLERAGWVGLPALAFAVLAAARRPRDGEVRFHAGLALFGLAAALGVPPLPRLWRILPGFSMANPTRLLLMFCFGAATLAGLACDPEGEAASPRLLAWLGALALLALVVDFAAVGRVWGQLLPGEQGFAAGQAAAFVLEALVAGALLRKPAWRRWAALPAALFLLRPASLVNVPAPASLLYPATPGTRALAAAQGHGRFLGVGPVLAPDAGMPLGLRDVRGVDFAGLRRYQELVTGRDGDFGFWERADTLSLPPSLIALSALAVSPRRPGRIPPGWSAADYGDLLVYRAPAPGRRALFVPTAEIAVPAQALAAVRAPGFDPAKVVWLDDWFAAPQMSGARGSARITRDEADEVDVEVSADGPGWLVLLDSWYPGWRVSVDGRLASLRRADYAFRAVAVPGGVSKVRFTFSPWPLWIGLFLAALSAAGLAFVGWTDRFPLV
ncbi:MAG: hypothetical protein KGM24_09030, partial [Elusimicrobia bacterium]|nr:hypothetical protein [Elusimicrobiota bacterium]